MSTTTATSLSHPLKLTLYRGFPQLGQHVWSPFVNKLETRLRLSHIPYRVATGSMRDAPRGKIPYLGISPSPSEPESLHGDTTLITQTLIAQSILPDLNAPLTPAERAHDAGIRALLEDKLCFYLMREKWIDNYYVMRAGALHALPWVVQVVVGVLAYRGAVRTLHGQGTGRFSDEEVRGFKEGIWEGLSGLLEEARRRRDGDGEGKGKGRPFWVLGREEPTEADATVYGFVVSSLVCEAAPETQKMVRSFPVLVDYATRIHDEYFSDYDTWGDQV